MEEAMTEQCSPSFNTCNLYSLLEQYIDVEMLIYESTSDNTELDLSTGPQDKLQTFMFPHCELLRPQCYVVCHFMLLLRFMLEVINNLGPNVIITRRLHNVYYILKIRGISQNVWYDMISVMKVIKG